jgi:hypothetical protein
MKQNLKITFLFLLITLFSFSQEKLFFYQGKAVSESFLNVRIENSNKTIKYLDFVDLKSKPRGYFWIAYRNIDSLLLNYETFIKTDTFYFETRSQTFGETIILADILRQESEDTMHVVDFHFVNGELFTIQKSVNDIKRKYISCSDTFIQIHPKSNLLKEEVMGLPLLEIQDSIFVFNNRKVEFLLTKSDYERKFYGYIGTFKDESYYKNTYFYNLIDEISTFDIKKESETFVDVFYDSSTFYFISQRYKTVNPPSGVPATYLYYGPHHKNTGKYFFNENKYSISKLNIQSSQIFKSLLCSNGFLGMLDIMEESRMDAYLLDSMLVVFNFNKSEINYYSNDIKMNTATLDIKDWWYRNEFHTDEVRKKGYFLFLKDYRQAIIEIDYLTAAVKEIPLLSNVQGLFHWEVNDGRLYILKKEYPSHWKRILYSYNINDARLE